MKLLFSLMLICILCTGCAIHYRNEKSVSGKGDKIETPYGNADGLKAIYKSTVDIWIPWRVKDDK